MPRYAVYSQTAIEISMEAETPELAAQYARDRILGLLSNEMPSEIISIGFEPDLRWQAREIPADQDPLYGHPGPIVASGTDNDLREYRWAPAPVPGGPS